MSRQGLLLGNPSPCYDMVRCCANHTAQSLAVPTRALPPFSLAHIDVTPIHMACQHSPSWQFHHPFSVYILSGITSLLFSFKELYSPIQVTISPWNCLDIFMKTLSYSSYIINVPLPPITPGFLPCLHDIMHWIWGILVDEMYVCIYLCVHACIHLPHVCMFTCVYICVWVYVLFVSMYVYFYTHTHSYI